MKLLLIHPVLYLADQIMKTNASLDFYRDPNSWILVMLMCAFAGYPIITRLIAEIPSQKWGRLYFWWSFFFVFHLYGVVIYFFIDKFGENFIWRMRKIRYIEYPDALAIENNKSISELISTAEKAFPSIADLIKEDRLDDAESQCLELREEFLDFKKPRKIDQIDLLLLKIRNRRDELELPPDNPFI